MGNNKEVEAYKCYLCQFITKHKHNGAALGSIHRLSSWQSKKFTGRPQEGRSMSTHYIILIDFMFKIKTTTTNAENC